MIFNFRDWTNAMTWIGFKRPLVSGETCLVLFWGVCKIAALAGAGMKVPGNRTTRG
jgi:hypothetical protein